MLLVNSAARKDPRSATIDFDFEAFGCRFSQGVWFDGMRVGRDLHINISQFKNGTSFKNLRVGGSFDASHCTFSDGISFVDMRVEGSFYGRNCAFTNSWVAFAGSQFADVFLDGSTFDKVSIIDFSKMKADLISIHDLTFKTPSEIRRERMTFKLLRPMNADKLQFLLSPYDAELYTAMETSFRTHGYLDEADKIFIAKKRAERREKCQDFLRQCNKVVWASSMFQDMLAGYGKRLQNLLYWSLGFLVIGTFVFRNEKGMRPKAEKDTSQYAGRYSAFWYSLDLFLPIIKLGEADVWTPKDNRRWAHLYRKVHIIIGSLFVPIGLAAWTGIIK